MVVLRIIYGIHSSVPHCIVGASRTQRGEEANEFDHVDDRQRNLCSCEKLSLCRKNFILIITMWKIDARNKSQNNPRLYMHNIWIIFFYHGGQGHVNVISCQQWFSHLALSTQGTTLHRINHQVVTWFVSCYWPVYTLVNNDLLLLRDHPSYTRFMEEPRILIDTDTTGKTHIRPRPLVPVTALAGTNVQI
jgi:hypothetical protein